LYFLKLYFQIFNIFYLYLIKKYQVVTHNN